MDSELIKWLAQMPKNYSLSGSKTSFYNGEKQLKLFLNTQIKKEIKQCHQQQLTTLQILN